MGDSTKAIILGLLGSFLTGGLIFGLVGYFAQVHNVAYTVKCIIDPAQCEALLSVETSLENNKTIIGVLDGVLVTLSQDGSNIGIVTTNGNGQGRLCSPRGQVVLKAEKEGFNMDRVDITVEEGECRKTVNLSLSAAHCEAKLTVETANAIDNKAIGEVLVTLLQNGSVVGFVTTDSGGQGHLTSPRGEVVIKAEKDGFVMAPITIIVDKDECEKIIKLSLSPENSFPAQVVMNWIHLPMDLDLHVVELQHGSEICHCFWDARNCSGFSLDVDNAEGGENGAETITWAEKDVSSQYLVFVHKFSKDSAKLSNSGARIAFYEIGEQPITVNIPAHESSDKYWKVGCFEKDGFNAINELESAEPENC